jgi:hypothetical protein
MSRPDQRTDIMDQPGYLLSAKVNMGPAAGDKTLGCTRKQVAELTELFRLCCEDDMVNPVFVLNFDLRNDDNTGIILKERLPPGKPVRLEGITCTKYLDTFSNAATNQLLGLHETGDSDRERGMDVQVGSGKHGYCMDYAM